MANVIKSLFYIPCLWIVIHGVRCGGWVATQTRAHLYQMGVHLFYGTLGKEEVPCRIASLLESLFSLAQSWMPARSHGREWRRPHAEWIQDSREEAIRISPQLLIQIRHAQLCLHRHHYLATPLSPQKEFPVSEDFILGIVPSCLKEKQWKFLHFFSQMAQILLSRGWGESREFQFSQISDLKPCLVYKVENIHINGSFVGEFLWWFHVFLLVLPLMKH